MAKEAEANQTAQPACQKCGGQLDWRSGVCQSCGTINEFVILEVKQSRLRGGSLVSPHSVTVTNRALRFKDPKMLGMRENIREIPFDHISSIEKKGGLRGSTLVMYSGSHGKVELEGISGEDADKIIAIYKKYTTAVPETPRQQAPPRQPVPPQASKEDPMKKLTQLKNMLDAGLISEDEYNAKKAEILSKI